MSLPKPKLLVVEDEKLLRWSLLEQLRERGYDVFEAGDGKTAREVIGREQIDLALLDFRLPDTDGIQLLRYIKERDEDILVLLMTAHSDVENAVEAMKLGAYHYANKPFDIDEMAVLIENALETTRLRREVRALRKTQSAPYGLDAIIGESQAMQDVRTLLAKIASSAASTVLITGESGTGKDLAAKVLHYNSQRAAGPFVNITCSALPESLLESELFGHEKGAFTDARAQKLGLLEQAAAGTVFLDEIGEMEPALQAKLLRFLEEKAFKRVGGTSDIQVDVRVIAATNRDLAEQVREGRFREDLYYRLLVLPVEMPPLRDRKGDVPLLVNFFIDRFNHEFRKSVRPITNRVAEHLSGYGWPGNVRELRNAVERAMLLTDSEELGVADFPMLAPPLGDHPFRLPPAGVDIERLERDLVLQALERTDWKQTQAAQLLGMNRDQIRYRIEKFGLKKEA